MRALISAAAIIAVAAPSGVWAHLGAAAGAATSAANRAYDRDAAGSRGGRNESRASESRAPASSKAGTPEFQGAMTNAARQARSDPPPGVKTKADLEADKKRDVAAMGQPEFRKDVAPGISVGLNEANNVPAEHGLPASKGGVVSLRFEIDRTKTEPKTHH